MQDIVGQAWASCIYFSHQRENEASKVAECYWDDNSCRKFVVPHCWHQCGWAYDHKGRRSTCVTL